LLIDNTATTVHLPGSQNPGECHLYFAEGCHLYIALTTKSRGIDVMGNAALSAVSKNITLTRASKKEAERPEHVQKLRHMRTAGDRCTNPNSQAVPHLLFLAKCSKFCLSVPGGFCIGRVGNVKLVIPIPVDRVPAKKMRGNISRTPDDIQQIGSLFLQIIIHYYKDVRRQAALAFIVAFVFEIAAVGFFVFSANAAMRGGTITTAALSAVSGLLIQIMTGVVFYLYSQSARQFGAFHICLERTNCFLLAHSMTEHLPEAERVAKQAEIITVIVNAPMLTPEITEKASSNSVHLK
jgi:hypothetical protein